MTKIPNPVTIQKDTSPYLYLTDFSGIYVNEYSPLVYNSGINIDVNEQESSTFYLVSFQIWFRYPKNNFDSTLKLFSIENADGTIDFTVTPILGGKQARVTTTEPCQLHKNGNICSSFIVHPEEWTSLYVIFDNPIPFPAFKGRIILHPNFVFNNIAQYIYENEIGTITTTVSLTWQRVLQPSLAITNTWNDVYLDGTWQEVVVVYSVQSDFTLSGDYIYGNQSGTSVIVNDDLSTLKTYANGVDLFTDIEWQKIEKSLV